MQEQEKDIPMPENDHSIYDTIIAQLSAHGILYTILEHKPVYTMQEAAEVCENKPEQGVKVLFTRAYTSKKKYDYCLLVWTGNKQVDFKQITEVLNVKKVKLASAEEVQEKLGLEIGSLSPFGYESNYPVVVDKNLMEQEIVFINPGIHSKTITLQSNDLHQMIKESTTDSVHYVTAE